MSNKKGLKIGDKVKIITADGLEELGRRENQNGFKFIYGIIEEIRPHHTYPYNIGFIDYKGIRRDSYVFLRSEIEKID